MRNMTTENYQPPFFERENSRYDIVLTLGTKYLFGILFGSYKYICMQRDLLYIWLERYSTEHFLITMNYAQNITFYHFFFYKSCRSPTKGVMFSDSKYNVLTKYNDFILNAATSSFLIICRALLYYKTTGFLSIRERA